MHKRSPIFYSKSILGIIIKNPMMLAKTLAVMVKACFLMISKIYLKAQINISFQ